MEDKAGIQIGKRAFFSSFFVLLALMILAGILTMVVPAGEFERADVDGRTVIITESYQTVDKPDYPFWRWLTAPAEVITIGPDRLTLGVLVIFIMLMAAAFAILDKSGILGGMIAGIVRRYGARKYTLLMIVTFVFMLMGALFGIMEEAVMLLPMMLALSYRMGWDALVGLGMSVLALKAARITGKYKMKPGLDEALKRHKALLEFAGLEKEIASLRKTARKEKQPARLVELNAQLKLDEIRLESIRQAL